MLSHPANIDLKETSLAFDKGKKLMAVYSPKLVNHLSFTCTHMTLYQNTYIGIDIITMRYNTDL